MPIIQAYFGSLAFRAIYSKLLKIDADNAYPMTVATLFGTMWIMLALFGQGGVWAYCSGRSRPERMDVGLQPVVQAKAKRARVES